MSFGCYAYKPPAQFTNRHLHADDVDDANRHEPPASSLSKTSRGTPQALMASDDALAKAEKLLSSKPNDKIPCRHGENA